MKFLFIIFVIFVVCIIVSGKMQKEFKKVTANNFQLITFDIEKNEVTRKSLITGEILND
jgi:hypothetical protein